MRVLFITYHFPPDAEVGAVRPYQFARLLPKHGIEPWILTVRPEFIERPENPSAIEGVPSERIIRTSVGQTRRMRFIQFASNLKGKLRSQRAVLEESTIQTPPQTNDINSEGFLRSTPFLRLLLEWLWFPDPMAGWREPGLEAAEKIISAAKIRRDFFHFAATRCSFDCFGIVASPQLAVAHGFARPLV